MSHAARAAAAHKASLRKALSWLGGGVLAHVGMTIGSPMWPAPWDRISWWTQLGFVVLAGARALTHVYEAGQHRASTDAPPASSAD